MRQHMKPHIVNAHINGCVRHGGSIISVLYYQDMAQLRSPEVEGLLFPTRMAPSLTQGLKKNGYLIILRGRDEERNCQAM